MKPRITRICFAGLADSASRMGMGAPIVAALGRQCSGGWMVQPLIAGLSPRCGDNRAHRHAAQRILPTLSAKFSTNRIMTAARPQFAEKSILATLSQEFSSKQIVHASRRPIARDPIVAT